MSDFRDQSEVMKHFLTSKTPFLDGIGSEDKGLFFVEAIRREMYRELLKGLDFKLEKHGLNINTGEDFTIHLTWKNDVAKITEISFEIGFDERYIKLDPADQALGISVKDLKYSQVIDRTWHFKAIKDSLSEEQLKPGLYGLDGRFIYATAFVKQKAPEHVTLLSINNIFYQFDPVDAMNFLFTSPAKEVLSGRAHKVVTEVIQPQDGPD